MKLLIVNDTEPTLRFLEKNVPWNNHGISQCCTADSAEAARKIINKTEIDVILCDIQMPEENGLEFISWVSENGFDCECVFLTCYANFDYAKEAIRLGCRDYILFPATADAIAEAVGKVVKRRLDEQNSNRLKQLGQIWLDGLHDQHSPEGLSEQNPKKIIEDATHYILEHIKSPDLNSNDLASKYNLSLRHFGRLFKSITGVSVNQFIIRERMELAGRLLQNSDIPVVSISFEVGYNNYPYFTSAFKKHFGCTASQFREKHLKSIATK